MTSFDFACRCDYDPAIFYRKRMGRARKDHQCNECGAPIRPGEVYERVSGMWDRTDGVHVFETCERCRDLRVWVTNSIPCFCWAHGNLHEDAEGTIEDATFRLPEETAGLRFGLTRRLVAIRRESTFRRTGENPWTKKKRSG